MVKKVNAPTREHNTPRGAALPGERTAARLAVFTGMYTNLPCQEKKREVARAHGKEGIFIGLRVTEHAMSTRVTCADEGPKRQSEPHQ